MTALIEKMVLTNFRGASSRCEVCFDTSKPIVMIFGENGTGKSTLIDAIDFVANGKFGSLADRSVGNQPHTFIQTIGKTAKDLKVELTAGGGTWVGKLIGRIPEVTGGNGPLRVKILRRARLLKLVEAPPAKRYEELKGFIDVQNIETSERALRDAVKATETDLDRATAVLNESTSALDDLWKKEGSPGANASAWAKQKAGTDSTLLITRVKELQTTSRSLEDVKTKQQGYEDATAGLGDRRQELKAVNDEIMALPQVQGEQAVRLIELLQKTQTVIALPNQPTSCPVCEQPIVAETLRADISRRLATMSEHERLAKIRAQAELDLNTAETNQRTARHAFFKAVRETVSQVQNGKHTPSSVAKTSWQPFEHFLSSTSDGDEQLPDAKTTAGILISFLDSYATDLQSAQSDLNQQNAITTHIDRIATNQDLAKSYQALLVQMKLALTVCEDTRRSFTQCILDTVGIEMGRLYSIIHPNEPVGTTQLRMDPDKKGSIDQEATFAGHAKVLPQAYFSESHLDTLGFCAWLALAKLQFPKETIIVLDDIFTSVDGVHLTRIMRLLTDIVGEFAQVIVTTHYRTWRDRYRLTQGPGLSVQLLELHRWTLERGVCLSGTRLAIDELESVLARQPLDRQAVASQAGILLEAVLDRLSALYRRRLPRTPDGDWTLGDLLNACRKLLGVLEIEKTTPQSPTGAGEAATERQAVTTQIHPFLDDAGPLMFIRNQVGCHFNLSGADVADADVETFGKATVELVKALTCSKCGDIPDRKDGTHFRCGCKQTKMTPLEYDK